MNGSTLNWRMAARRKTACLLVILFTAAATVFLLIYPRFIESTRAELEYAYDSIDVTGWILNIKDYSDPSLHGHLWHTLLDSGYIGEHNSYSTARSKVYQRDILLEQAGSTSEEALLAALDVLIENETEASRSGILQTGSARGINRIQAENELALQQDTIQWMDGYDPSILTGSEQVCLLPEKLGWLPGDRVPVYLASPDVGGRTTLCLTVAGVYTGQLPDDVDLVLPLSTLEEVGRWFFCINGFSFTVADSRDVPALKEKLIELELHGVGQLDVRAALDDRILEGTVAPIKSNLALLQGLYTFFFGVVTIIGFFLCFLLARGRKPEYAVMRMLGESTLQVTLKALLEQFALCFLGIILGVAVVFLTKQGRPDAAACGIILGCYTLGAAVAVLLTVQVNVMDILRDKE